MSPTIYNRAFGIHCAQLFSPEPPVQADLPVPMAVMMADMPLGNHPLPATVTPHGLSPGFRVEINPASIGIRLHMGTDGYRQNIFRFV